MKRIFGIGKQAQPSLSLADTSTVLEKRGDHLDGKISKLDKELLVYKEQLKKAPPGAAQNRIKQKALHVLKQKKMYEQQRGSLESQQFNIDQLAFMQETTRGTLDQVACMRDTAKVMKKEMKKMKIDDIDALQDELQDIYEDSQEIQEILGRTYGVPEDVDEDDLEAELAGLGDDIMISDGVSYLDDPISGPSHLTGGTTTNGEETTDPNRLEQQLGL